MDEIGDCHISLALPPNAPPWIETQKHLFRDLIDEFGPNQAAILEQAGKLGAHNRTRWVMKRTLKECVLIDQTTDFIILYGVGPEDCVLL